MVKTNSKSGFTMVEVIAVLVIIGIMTAVAAPKFINMSTEARDKAALAGLSEAKATLSVAYAKAYLQNDGDQPDIGDVYTNAFGTATAGTELAFGDVKLTATVANPVVLTAKSLKGHAVSANITNSWTMPTQTF